MMILPKWLLSTRGPARTVGNVLAREPYEGCSVRRGWLASSGAGPGDSRLRLRDADGGWPFGLPAAKRVGGALAKSSVSLSPANPVRAKPKGATSADRTNPAARARDSGLGQYPEAAARWAGPRFGGGNTDEKNGMWVSRGGNASGARFGGESSAGRIPRAPPARNKAGAGSEGVSRREGNQTLRAERSGRLAGPASVDLRSLVC
jgi:hypothetical protein